MRKEESCKPADGEPRIGFILLNSPQVDWSAFINAMRDDWFINIDGTPDGDIFIAEHNGMRIICTFIGAPVPNNEAVENAKRNYLWKEAVDVCRQHKAQIVLAVLGGQAVERSLLFTMAAASCLKLENATAIYQNPMVWSKQHYTEFAQVIREGELPTPAWVYVGIYPEGRFFSGYTIGLSYFGKLEVEVCRSKQRPSDILGFLLDVSEYIIKNDVTLLDGQTIGSTEKEKLRISQSKGVAVEGESIKIAY